MPAGQGAWRNLLPSASRWQQTIDTQLPRLPNISPKWKYFKAVMRRVRKGFIYGTNRGMRLIGVCALIRMNTVLGLVGGRAVGEVRATVKEQ